VIVECIQEDRAFAALRPHWSPLLRASASDNPFLTWEWLHTWWRHFGTRQSLRLLVVRDGDTVVALAPFHLASATLYWFSRLEFLGTGEAGSDYLDIIARRGDESAALEAIARFLETQNIAVRMPHLRPGSVAARLARGLEEDGWAASLVDDGQCPVVSLAGHTFESFLATLGASHRANVRRRLRALERLGARFTRVTAHDERQRMLESLAAFHAGRYANRGGSTAFSTPAVRAFHEEATRLAHECGWLRMYALHVGDALVAVMYGFSYAERFYFYQHGHDAAHAPQSVGLALMALTIRAAIEEGAVEFDMLWGTEPYKALWAREARVLQRADLFPLRFSGAVHRRALDARRGVSQFARRVLSLGSPGAVRGT
jgi:CelD/BcsL family acetyltransferase involved in cellulose biosynthesis